MTLRDIFITIACSINDSFTAMLSILSDSQKAVVDTITMRLNLSQALEYVKHAGFEMSERTYYRHKRKVQEMKLERMHFIAKVAYEEQHLERVDRMELIENQMWTNYWHEKEPLKRVKILTHIVNIQPFISTYYEATKYLVEGRDFKLREQLSRLNPLAGINKGTVDADDGDLSWAEPENKPA